MVRVTVDQDLAIKDVAEQTGIAAGTIRMWEQRYGFPEPERTASGYRVYRPGDVEALRRVQAYRHRGLSVPAAIERARETGGDTDRPSIYAAVMSAGVDARPQVLRKSTLVALSRAIEHETLAHAAAPVLFAAFQREPFYREVEPRYARIARCADAATVFADFPQVRHPDGGTRRDADRADRRARQRVGRHRRRARLRRLPAGLGAARGHRARRPRRPRPPLRGDLDARPASRPAARRGRGGAAGRARGPGLRRAGCGGCSRTARWRSRSPPRR